MWNCFSFQTPLTLSSHNSGSKNYSNKNHHIFRKPWTSAFRWHTLKISEKNFNPRKKRLRLRSFGPFWTISTENQWEISEIGRLSCFIEFMLISLFPTPFTFMGLADSYYGMILDCDLWRSGWHNFWVFLQNLVVATLAPANIQVMSADAILTCWNEILLLVTL